MARKWGKIVSITAVVVVVITGIVVGTLFAVGVLHIHKGGSGSAPPVPPGPKPKPGPFTPIVTCNEIPTVKSFIMNPGGESVRLTFTPISSNCATVKSFAYHYNVYTDTVPQQSSYTVQEFKPSAGQTFVDVPWPINYWETNPLVSALYGQVWLQVSNIDGSDTHNSNNIPYTFIKQ